MALPENKARELLANDKLKYENYCLLFTDRFSLSYIDSLHKEYSSGKTQEAKEEALSNLQSAMITYSTLVHTIYPNDERFRKMIAASKELSGNFEKVSQWVDSIGGRQYAEAFSSGLEALGELSTEARGD